MYVMKDDDVRWEYEGRHEMDDNVVVVSDEEQEAARDVDVV